MGCRPVQTGPAVQDGPTQYHHGSVFITHGKGIMKRHHSVLALVIVLGVTVLALPASATVGVADPGFSYVDVNNDGLYNPADGDFGPVDPLILNDGRFDTSQSEGPYHAPSRPASLVLSRPIAPPSPSSPAKRWKR